ncbi:CDP-glycerol glycerophosphotransferase family protein [Lederbergia sp. NSJ-179]|uniref:CDP-glycerol glycerophosphotransferase family protein n=1 Tax=Lederbergia sp. NSJ-179 TaxID=2931402 RepID=UPI001FD5FD85|nr:CDP-glycerol glycerophosphotransferase family protein [Lederbergia sp. NSJ-179]MCJ7840644.1 CDP-glycerol glycerophosphotransferase family protein [Lederbergia sp. NSJ-179]
MKNKLDNLLTRYVALKIYTKRNNVQGMYRNLLKLKPIYKNKTDYYYRLSRLAYRQKKWRQALDHINSAMQLAGNHSPDKYHLFKADCYIQLGESAEAVSYLTEYLSTKPADAQAWHKLANEHNKLRQWKDAASSFESYLKLHPEDSKASFQLAECYRKLEDYQHAEANYRQAVSNLDHKHVGQSLADSHYWLGLMQLRNHNPDQAFRSFNKAIELDQKLKSQRFGIGVFHEHFKQWEYAIEAYKSQLQQNEKDAELQFKLASLLDKKLYAPEDALKYYEKALELDKIRSPWHFALANCYEQLEDYQNAAEWYESAIARQEKHRPGNYRRLGYVLGQLGKTEEALAAYKEAELFDKPSMIDQKFYKKHINKAKVRYAISYEHYSVNDKIVFYESLGGTRMMDSPYAIFEYIVDEKDFKNYTHIWVVNTFEVIPVKFRSMKNIIFVKKDSDAYFKYIASAKYLICNSTFEPYVVRKPDQLYLQTSHGIFYKTVGRDSAANPVGVAGSTRNLLQATHIIVPNEYMAEKQPMSYSIKGINYGEIAKIGYPRIDVTINITDEAKHQITSRLGIDSSKKIVLYVPTWRGTKANTKFDSTKLIEDLKMLAELDVNVVFRGHPISNRLLKKVKLPENIIVPPPDILTNELLGIADIVISDYSSVFFDFLVTERPIIHYLYDVDVYTKERGLNLSEDELPGTVAKNSQQLIDAVMNKLQNDKPSSHYLAAKNRFCPYDDGRSSERIVKWFFYGDNQDINFVDRVKSGKSYLYLGGVLRDKSGIPNLVNKLNHLKKNGNTVSIMLKKELSKDKDKLGMLTELNSDINLIAHDKNMPTTLEEAAAINYFHSEGKFINKKMELAYKQSFKREARRLFGDSRFDEVVNYETNSNYWNALQESIQATSTLD